MNLILILKDPYLVPYGQTYIPASYVKWLQSAGAQVVPVPYNADRATLQKLFNSLNGILFTGGGLDLGISKTNSNHLQPKSLRTKHDLLPNSQLLLPSS